MIVPRHGGGLLKPIAKGQTLNPGGRGGEYQETVRLARQHSVQAMHKLITKMDSDDERVGLIATQSVLERAWGKPKEYDLSGEKPPIKVDVSRLTLPERKALLRMLDAIQINDGVGTVEPPPEIQGAADSVTP